MVALGQANAGEVGISNVEFLLGNIESIPPPDDSVDIVISNCVINLAGDKTAVLREAYRVLKKGGNFAVADIVLRDGLPEAARRNVSLWTGCIAGALTKEEYLSGLRDVGFQSTDIEEIRTYTSSDVRPRAEQALKSKDSRTIGVGGQLLQCIPRRVDRKRDQCHGSKRAQRLYSRSEMKDSEGFSCGAKYLIGSVKSVSFHPRSNAKRL